MHRKETPVTDADLALRCHDALNLSIQLGQVAPSVVNMELLDALHRNSVRLFKPAMQAQGYSLLG